jgi:hypothetical protein
VTTVTNTLDPLARSMTNSRTSARRDARPLPRAAGPFEAYRLGASDVQVQVRDLTLAGCIVEPEIYRGRHIRLQIDLPGEGWITVQGDALRRQGPTLTVRFIHLDDATRARIERTVERLSGPAPW